MAFLTVVASSRFPLTNNQLRTSYNMRNQTTIQDGRVTMQQVQGRQWQSYSGTGYKSNATSSGGNNKVDKQGLLKAITMKDKAMLAEAKEARQILDEEQLIFLADPGVLDEVPHSETYLNDMENQSVHAMQDFEKSPVVDFTDKGKSKKSSHQPEAEDTNQEKLYLLHMDLCGLMRVDRLFQPMFDEYFNPSSIVVSLVQEAVAPRAVVLADSPVLTSIDQDAPSTSIPLTQEQEHSLNISQGFKESPKTLPFHDDPLHESLHEDSTFQESSSNVRQIYTLFEHLSRWTKDHPIENIISDPSRSVST
uniref:Integrase, catalytic region, zinc finger, CCHC-type, peptidase aspartic, catalytic n=1 Tax=Tanacetum cinerariifolium TaxID=118510 RepID=A0A6L2KCH0_TANCI|nr:hypothetical protein [Tanacetum cinerariifolium]